MIQSLITDFYFAPKKRKLQQREVICHREVFVGKIIPPPPLIQSMEKDSIVLEGVKGEKNHKVRIEFHRLSDNGKPFKCMTTMFCNLCSTTPK